jgi:hypothetical protein
MTCGVFFQRRTSRAWTPNSLDLHVALEQLGSALGDGVDIQPGQLGDASVPAMSQAQGLEPGIQSALALVQRAEEQDDGRSCLVRGLRQGVTHEGHRLRGHRAVAQMHLLSALGPVGREIHVVTGDLVSHEAAHVDELEQRLLDRSLELSCEFRGQIPAVGARDKLLCCVDESTEARKVGPLEGPQSSVVKLGQGVKRVELAAVRVAAVVGEFLQLAQDSSIYRRAQGSLHLQHCDDPAAPKQGEQGVSFELGCAHNV